MYLFPLKLFPLPALLNILIVSELTLLSQDFALSLLNFLLHESSVFDLFCSGVLPLLQIKLRLLLLLNLVLPLLDFILVHHDVIRLLQLTNSLLSLDFLLFRAFNLLNHFESQLLVVRIPFQSQLILLLPLIQDVL